MVDMTFYDLSWARSCAKSTATMMESRVPIYRTHDGKYCLWSGKEIVEWVDPDLEIADDN